MKPFTFYPHQRDQLARAALADGAIVAWDPGLGKTFAIFAWPWMKQCRRQLIVAPGQLHDQIIAEGEKFFGVTAKPLTCQEDFYKYELWKSAPTDPPKSIQDIDYYITDYHALGMNGADELPTEKPNAAFKKRVFDFIKASVNTPFSCKEITSRKLKDASKPAEPAALTTLFDLKPELANSRRLKAAILHQLTIHYPPLFDNAETIQLRFNEIQRLGAKALIQSGLSGERAANTLAELKAMAVNRAKEWLEPFASWHMGIGQTRGDGDDTIRCVRLPSLSSLCRTAFDSAVCDEATRIKGMVTYLAHGVRNLEAPYRVVLTGTPIKNRLPDIFALAHWVAKAGKEGNARFPYGSETKHRDEFSKGHLVMEENLSANKRAEANGESRRYVKQTNRICNIHRVWKQFGSIILRTRKEDATDQPVKKEIIPVITRPGTSQLETYKYHLENPPECENKMAAKAVQLNYLRQATLCPWSMSIGEEAPAVSPYQMTPKLYSLLDLTSQLIEEGEQFVIFSPFLEFSRILSRYMEESGIRYCRVDGTNSPKQRGAKAQEFKKRTYSVMIAGLKSMGEGISLECASHLALPSIELAYDINAQAIERVHRLSSPKDVKIYIFSMDNSVDLRLVNAFAEKGDSSDLALDGRLFDQEKKEISADDIIREEIAAFRHTNESIDESELLKSWRSTLRGKLIAAQKQYDIHHGLLKQADTTAA